MLVRAYTDSRKSCHQSCSLTVLSSKYMVLDKKSMPIVACMRVGPHNSKRKESIIWDEARIHSNLSLYLVGVVKFVVHEARDDACFPHGLVPQEHLQEKEICRDAFRPLEVSRFKVRWCEVLTSLYFARGDTVPPLAILIASLRPR